MISAAKNMNNNLYQPVSYYYYGNGLELLLL